MIDLRNLNIWLAVSALGGGVIAMVVVALAIQWMLTGVELSAELGQFVFLLLTFVAVFLLAMITGRIAKENAVSYGLICSVGAVLVIIFAVPFSVMTVLTALVAVAGGLNGGVITERSNRRHHR